MYSSTRKQVLSGWLKRSYPDAFASTLKLQKFLFFYEALAKTEGDTFEFNKLRGYKNGPVFSDVWGDQIYEPDLFNDTIDKAYADHPNLVHQQRARLASFLVRILNERDLSELTHGLNIWKARETDIMSGIRNVPLNGNDLNADDQRLLLAFKQMYPEEYIDSVSVVDIAGRIFIIPKSDLPRLTDETKNVFISLAEDDSLQNPVYIKISAEGTVLVD